MMSLVQAKKVFSLLVPDKLVPRYRGVQRQHDVERGSESDSFADTFELDLSNRFLWDLCISRAQDEGNRAIHLC